MPSDIGEHLAPAEQVYLPTGTLQKDPAVVEAIAAGQGERAALLLYEHAMRSRERLHQIMGQGVADAPAMRSTKPRKADARN